MLVDISQLQLSELRSDKRLPNVPITLLERIEQFGQVDPVIVRSIGAGRFEILRHADIWLAIQRLGRFEVDILVRDKLSDAEADRLVNAPMDLDPISEAELFQSRLGVDRQRGAITALAQQFKVSRSHIAHTLRLLELPETIQAAVRVGRLRRGHAKALLTLSSDADQHRFALKVVQGRWSVGKTETEVRSYVKQGAQKIERRSKAAETLRLERQLTEIIGSSVTIDETRGTLTINYQHNLEVLDGVISRITGGELMDFDTN